MMFGEMDACLLLQGQGVIPARLMKSGYDFKYPALTNALHQEFQ